MLSNLDTVGTLLLTLVAVVVCRQLVRTGHIRNPFDNRERNFQLAPILRDATLCAACFTAALGWTVLVGLAIKHRVLPDSYWTVYGLLLVPILGFGSGFALFLARALITTAFGKRK